MLIAPASARLSAAVASAAAVVDSDGGGYDPGATVELFNVQKGYKHRMATCDQIVAVVGQIA